MTTRSYPTTENLPKPDLEVSHESSRMTPSLRASTEESCIDRGYARKLSNLEAKMTFSKTNYLPHHTMLNPNKPGKVRVVFDAAAKHEGTSLNQNLLQGPDRTNNLVGVLLRFRQDWTALMADVEAMFHQVKVAPEDQDAFRFLWWSSDADKPSDKYVMTVDVFGATDSPCCANYSLKRTAEDNRDKYEPIVIDTVLRHFYVDDMLRALKNKEIAIRVANDPMSLLARGGFRLTKSMSNSPTVLEAIRNDERAAPSKNLDLDELPVERALRIGCNVKEDTLCKGFYRVSRLFMIRWVLLHPLFYLPNRYCRIAGKENGAGTSLWRVRYSKDGVSGRVCCC